MNTKLIKHCPYCMSDVEIANISVREIPDYKNAITGKNTAIIEKLSCGHEFVDGKFDIDKIYFSSDGKPQNLSTNEVKYVSFNYHYNLSDTRKNRVNLLDIACLICLVFLAFACPPLIIIPVLYFIGRMR